MVPVITPPELEVRPTGSDPAGRETRAVRDTLLLMAALERGHTMRVAVRGRCMWPQLKPGDHLLVQSLVDGPRLGDVVVSHTDNRLFAHRVLRLGATQAGQRYAVCRGDASLALDAPILVSDLLGVVTYIERAGRRMRARQRAHSSSRVLAVLRPTLAWLRSSDVLGRWIGITQSLARGR